jgi:hypothetical protein
MNHLKLFEDFLNENYVDFFATEHNYSPFGIIRNEDDLEIRDLHISQETAKDLDPFGWFDFIFDEKKPIVFGKSKFQKDLAELKDLCDKLEVGSVVHSSPKKLDKMNMTGDAETLDAVFELTKRMSKTEY